MHELYCPSCNTPSQFNFSDYLQMCPVCSATFRIDLETGQKEIYGDHYIIPNHMDAVTAKDLSLEWLRRIHHRPGQVDREFFVVDVQGFSIPVWTISLEAHTAWKGLVQKKSRNQSIRSSADFLTETGQFRRSYRWCILGRNNICETWGLTRLHQPQEPIGVEWDGFPLDSTLSRGRLTEEEEKKTAYEIRHFFEFKYASGMNCLSIQVGEEEALRRAMHHVEFYHHKLSGLNVDYLIDCRTELEIAGIQLIHIPMWKVGYIYRPKSVLKYFYRPKEKQLLMDGYSKGVLNGELAIIHQDKQVVNAIICGLASVLFIVLGSIWHPAFLFVALFALIVGAISIYFGLIKPNERESESGTMVPINPVNKRPDKEALSA